MKENGDKIDFSEFYRLYRKENDVVVLTLPEP